MPRYRNLIASVLVAQFGKDPPVVFQPRGSKGDEQIIPERWASLVKDRGLRVELLGDTEQEVAAKAAQASADPTIADVLVARIEAAETLEGLDRLRDDFERAENSGKLTAAERERVLLAGRAKVRAIEAQTVEAGNVPEGEGDDGEGDEEPPSTQSAPPSAQPPVEPPVEQPPVTPAVANAPGYTGPAPEEPVVDPLPPLQGESDGKTGKSSGKPPKASKRGTEG
jgi:hypothetical protein